MITKLKLIIAISAMTFLTQCSTPKKTTFQTSWEHYQQYYIESGRVIDTANKNISHSESQGYGLLFAVFANDQSQFKNIWGWTRKTLQRSDHLFSWKYVPSSEKNCTKNCIPDPNNASDGDILIAWSLLIAAEKWDKTIYLDQAIKILDSIKSKLIRKRFGYTLLLPAERGFEQADGKIQINLSYWVFPAFKKFTRVTKDPIWQDLYDSGITLTKEIHFGKWNLPSDWTMIGEASLNLVGVVSPYYGYNACRVPIYLMLANQKQQEDVFPFLMFWSQPTIPATVNLITGKVAEYQYSSGMKAISIATKAIVKNQKNAPLPEISKDTDYYSASLILLSQLALLKD